MIIYGPLFDLFLSIKLNSDSGLSLYSPPTSRRFFYTYMLHEREQQKTLETALETIEELTSSGAIFKSSAKIQSIISISNN